MNIKNILGVLLLMVGLIAGVFLVQQSQEFRERAGLEKEQLVVVCHKSLQQEGAWEEIEVSESNLEEHIDHGDILGNCPKDFVIIEGQKSNNIENSETIKIAENNTSSVKESNKAIDTPESNEVPDAKTTPSVTVIEKDATFRFFIWFYGLDVKRPARLVSVTFAKGESEEHVYKNIRVSPNSKGVFFGEISSVPSGTFDISFKTDSHLRRTFEDIVLKSGVNTWYFENNPLIPGDFNSDNVVDVNDIALIMAELTSESVNVANGNARYDVDMDASIDMKDVEIVLENLNKVSLMGDK